VLQCVAVCCSVLWRAAMRFEIHAVESNVCVCEYLFMIHMCLLYMGCMYGTKDAFDTICKTITLCCSMLQCVTVRCSALQCVAVRSSTLQYVAVCYSVMVRVASQECGKP